MTYRSKALAGSDVTKTLGEHVVARRHQSRLRLLGCLNVAAGLWLLTAPFVLGMPHTYPHQHAFLSSLLIGAAVLTLATLHMLRWDTARVASRLTLYLGLFLMVTPVFFGYWQFHGAGRHATGSAVLTGLFIVAGSVLSLAGSEDASSEEDPSSSPLTQPVLWPEPGPDGVPRPYTRRAEPDAPPPDRRRQLLAWTAVGVIIAGVIVLAFALVLHSWAVTGVGLLLAGGGGVVAIRARILTDVSVSQRATQV